MKKISILFLLLFLLFGWTSNAVEYQEAKLSGNLINECNDDNFYFALYNLDNIFKAKYDEINKNHGNSSDINKKSLIYFPNQIDIFWNKLSESQQKMINKWCFIDERIRQVTSSETDDGINFAAIIYQMPDLKFIIDAYISNLPQLYYSIDYWLHYEPYFDFIRYLTYQNEEDLEEFMINYQSIYNELKELNI